MFAIDQQNGTNRNFFVDFLEESKGASVQYILALCTFLKRTGIDWRERRLISKLYMDQKVKVRLDRGRQEVCRLEEELDKDAVCHQFCSTCRANGLPRKLWMGLETSASEDKLYKL